MLKEITLFGHHLIHINTEKSSKIKRWFNFTLKISSHTVIYCLFNLIANIT